MITLDRNRSAAITALCNAGYLAADIKRFKERGSYYGEETASPEELEEKARVCLAVASKLEEWGGRLVNEHPNLGKLTYQVCIGDSALVLSVPGHMCRAAASIMARNLGLQAFQDHGDAWVSQIAQEVFFRIVPA